MIQALQNYVTRMLEVPNMKALLLDKETTGIISMVYTQSQIIQKEVFLVEQIDIDEKTKENQKDVNMQHLKAVCFIRPTDNSVKQLKEHLRHPKFQEYHVFFSNILREDLLRSLAEADTNEVVKQVQEFYGDYFAVNPDLFHANSPRCQQLYQPEMYWRGIERDIFERNCGAMMSSLLALKKKPLIRFARTSELAKVFAVEVSKRIKNEPELFFFQENPNPPLLLILDRRDDPVTPLLTQWTYQAMVHELFTIDNNRVRLPVNKDSKSRDKEKEKVTEVVLSCEHDKFFKGAMYLNFGDLGSSIKELVDSYQRELKTNQKINSIDEMREFVEKYPEFKALSGNVTKHVSVMSEMSHQVEVRDLLNLSELEQTLAVNQDHAAALDGVLHYLNNPKLTDADRLRLVILYALRYENQKNEIPTLKSLLRDRAGSDVARDQIRAVDMMLQYAGSKVRGGDLFGSKGALAKFTSVFAGVKGVENVYTQHKPLLHTILDELIKSKLKLITYPYVEGGSDKMKHDDIIVYIIGGATYEEAFTVANFNKSNAGVKIILGGSCIHNSASFLNDILSSGPNNSQDDEKGDFR